MWKLIVAGLCLAVIIGGQLAEATCDTTTWTYRTIDGHCNNLQNGLWGTPNRAYARAVAPDYGDGTSTPRRAQSGQELPNPRFLSTSLFEAGNVLDPDLTLLNMQFGQLVAHDMSLTGGVFDALPCCKEGQMASNPAERCFAVPLPANDPIYAGTGMRCQNMIRTTTTENLNPGSGGGQPVEQINTVTSYLDLSIVYGVDQQQNSDIRAFIGGQLKVINRDGANWPPDHPTRTGCQFAKPQSRCYLTGDRRANQSPHLTILQIAFMREHNRIAEDLQRRHPSWSDWRLFEEARRINIGQYQYIVYYEWLPNILGWDAMISNGLIYPYLNSTYVNDYDVNVDATVINEHTTAAMRYFHTEITGHLRLLDASRNLLNVTRLSSNLNNPAILEESRGYEKLALGLATQPMALIDEVLDEEVKHFLFRGNNQLGEDLRTTDIQRARDHGLAGYNDIRKYCGFPPVTDWAQFANLIDPQDIAKLRSLYATVDDVEYTVAAFFELDYPSSQIGWTFHCLLARQFQRTRRGDRFFFENGQPPGRFTLPQLQSIRKASIAKILCNTTPNMERIQPNGFQQIGTDNPLTACSSLPSVNLSLW